jgi:hypothetical protein
MTFRLTLAGLGDFLLYVFGVVVLACPIVLYVAYQLTGNETFIMLLFATAIFWFLAWGSVFVWAYTIWDMLRGPTAQRRRAAQEERERLQEERRRAYEDRRRENQGPRSSGPSSNGTANGSGERAGSVSTEELKKLFRAAAMRVHPDLAVDDEDRERRTALMRSVNRAYETRDVDALRRFSSMNI